MCHPDFPKSGSSLSCCGKHSNDPSKMLILERMGATIVGASETIFYTMAIYYGSLKIKNTRHTLTCAMISHVVGVIASVFICYIMFV